MRITVGQARFEPNVDDGMKERIVNEALRQVARRIDMVGGNMALDDIPVLTAEMPIAITRVLEGYYSEKAAADFLANRIFKLLLPLMGDSARQQDILNRANVYGAAEGFKRVGGPPITVEYLKQVGLTPKWSAEIAGVRYHFSDAFNVGTRTAVVAYVEEGGVVHTRVFYTSQSQGVWRAASHRVEGASHLGISERWIGKGNPHEESTDVPYELYQMLNERARAARAMAEAESEGVFYGLLERKTFEDLLKGQDKPTEGFFPGEATALGSFSQPADAKFGVPESFRFSDPYDAPDYSKLITSWRTDNPMYGPVEAYVFPSYNGKLAFLFYRELQRGRAWVASVQDVSAMITSRGARRHIIDAGSLTMPLMEYKDQIPEAYRGGFVKDNYFDAWNYVGRLPVIQNLYRAMGWAWPA